MITRKRKRLPIIPGNVIKVTYTRDQVLPFFFSWSIIRLENRSIQNLGLKSNKCPV